MLLAVTGTPGRVYDMIQKQHLRTRHIKTLILDEADEMLSKGFTEQIYNVYRYLPPETQVRAAAAACALGIVDGRRCLRHFFYMLTEPLWNSGRLMYKHDCLCLAAHLPVS